MKLVVGTDGSEGAQRALGWCAHHALALDADVVVVHAIELPVYPVPPMATGTPPYVPEADEQLRDELEAQARRDMDTWCAPLRAAGVHFETVVLTGDPAVTLQHVADEEDADLLVVGSRGRGGLAELVLGSVSRDVVHGARRPVVVVPHGVGDAEP